MPSNPVTYRLLDSLIQEIAEREGHGDTLRDALYIVSAIGRSGLVVLPERPDATMLSAGAAAGNLKEETVQNILDAMVKAAS